MDQNNRKQTVHVNRLKPAYDLEAWKPKAERKTVEKLRKKPNLRSEEEENETKFGPHPLLEASQPEFRTERQVPLDQTPVTTESSPLPHPLSNHRIRRTCLLRLLDLGGKCKPLGYNRQSHDPELELCLKRM